MKRLRIVAALVVALAAPAGASLGADDAFPPAKGESWPLPDPDLYDVAAHGDSAWAVGYWGSVLRSTDQGRSWTKVRTPTTNTLFAVSFADEQHGWAVGAYGAIVRSSDGGVSWRAQPTTRVDPISGATLPLDSHMMDVSAVGPNEAWAVGDFGVVLRTTDGETWSPVVIPPELYTDGNTPERIFNAVHFADAQRGWIAGEFGTILRTEDGGATWQPPALLGDSAPDLYLYAISRRGAGMIATSGLAGRVLASRDEGLTFEARAIETGAGIFGIDALGDRVVAVGDRGVLFVSADGGASWRSAERPRLFNWLTAVTSASERVVLVVGENGLVLRSEDGGERFARVTGAEPPPKSAISVPDVPGPQRRSVPDGDTR